MENNMIQVGVCAIRAPDGRVIKDAPLFLPGTKQDRAEAEWTYREFARVAAQKMREAKKRDILLK